MSDQWQKVGRWAREITAKRVAIVAIIPTVLAILTTFGVNLPTDWTAQTVQEKVTVVATALSVIVGVLWARSGTTVADPNLQPVSSTGEPLVTLSEAQASVAPPGHAAADAFRYGGGAPAAGVTIEQDEASLEDVEVTPEEAEQLGQPVSPI